MAPRYTQEHYDGIARIIAANSDGGEFTGGMGRSYWSTEEVASIFADRFAADDPKRCDACGSTPDQEAPYPCLHADGHNWVGFDRAPFLEACGLKSEGVKP